ncbi:sensor histidine kinase [Hymenobacter gummosus]|nr:sensor histidine kinase [Hymenobacter gummosus]
MARFFTRQRLLHILVHLVFWVSLPFLPWAILQQQPPHFSFWRAFTPVLRMAVLFYLNYWVLIPRLLARRRVALYGLAVLALMLLLHLPMSLHWLGLGTPPPPRPGGTLAGRQQFQAVIILITVLVWMVSSGLRITSEWFENERVRRQMHHDKLTAELSFLKSQVSPHFLFNTLNNIYSLAQLRSDDTPEAILKLSQLMRYMLYEANDPRVPLEQEVEYLRNYVDLQRLRLADDVAIEFSQEGNLAGKLIEPMLLIPFVENAFKHGVSYQHTSFIHISLRVLGDELLFRVQNRRFPQLPSLTAARDSGIGVQNVTQRLRLLYPDRHLLHIEPTADEYIVTLTLALPHATLPVS